jgi:hypothetical protein
MYNIKLALKLIIPGFVLGVIFAALALGVAGPGVFDTSDRAYFGFAAFLGVGVGCLGILMLLIQKKKPSPPAIDDK